MALATRPSGRGLPMTTSSTSRSVRSLATASSSGTSPFMGTSDDEVTMMRPGTGSTSVTRPEHGVVDAHRHDGHPVEVHPHLGGDVRLGGLRHRDHPGQGPGHLHLHAQEAEPAALGELLPRVGGVAEGQLPIDGDRVVQGGQHRPSVLHHAQDPVAQALVVVHQVELVPPGGEQAAGPEAERPRLREPGRAHHPELQRRDRRRIGVAELAPIWESGTDRGRGRGRDPGTGVKPTPSSTSGHGWPANTSTEWPRATSSRVRCRV